MNEIEKFVKTYKNKRTQTTHRNNLKKYFQFLNTDPDTYFKLHYQDASKYGTKEDNLKQLELVLERHPKVLFQIPHFGAQPEIHRLPNLARWLDRFPNVILD